MVSGVRKHAEFVSTGNADVLKKEYVCRECDEGQDPPAQKCATCDEVFELCLRRTQRKRLTVADLVKCTQVPLIGWSTKGNREISMESSKSKVLIGGADRCLSRFRKIATQTRIREERDAWLLQVNAVHIEGHGLWDIALIRAGIEHGLLPENGDFSSSRRPYRHREWVMPGVDRGDTYLRRLGCEELGCDVSVCKLEYRSRCGRAASLDPDTAYVCFFPETIYYRCRRTRLHLVECKFRHPSNKQPLFSQMGFIDMLCFVVQTGYGNPTLTSLELLRPMEFCPALVSPASAVSGVTKPEYLLMDSPGTQSCWVGKKMKFLRARELYMPMPLR